MARKLVLFIGKPRYERDDDGNLTGEYSTLRYAFDDGFTSRETSLFGVALLEYLRHADRPPDELLVMGTRSSNWDALHEIVGLDDDARLWRQMELEDAADEGTVDESDIDEVGRLIGQHLGVDVKCELVGMAANRDAQMNILSTLSEFVEEGDRVVFDITHGLRHFGLVALESGFLLEQERPATVEGVYYGNFHSRTDDGAATAVTLGAISELTDWADALSTFRRTGLLGKIPSFFENNSEVASPLRELKFALSANRFGQIAHTAGQAIGALRKVETDSIDGPRTLFIPKLLDELQLFTEHHLADLQLELTDRAFNTGDYLRSTIGCFEALVSTAIGDRDDRKDGFYRNHVSQLLRKNDDIRDQYFDSQERGVVDRLRHIRNALAHGTPPSSKKARNILSSDQHCRSFLGQALQTVDTWVDRHRDNDALHSDIDHRVD